jgi:hypothetical protein
MAYSFSVKLFLSVRAADIAVEIFALAIRLLYPQQSTLAELHESALVFRR